MKEIEKVMELLGVTKYRDLARELNVAENTISGWKRRGVPENVLREWAIKFGKTVEWFRGEEKPLDEIKRLCNREMDILIEEARDRQSELGLMEDFHAFIRTQHEKMKSEL